jgi:hypothetical protein
MLDLSVMISLPSLICLLLYLFASVKREETGFAYSLGLISSSPDLLLPFLLSSPSLVSGIDALSCFGLYIWHVTFCGF